MKSGLQQRLQVAHIELSPQTKKELDERFVLIYTGQRIPKEKADQCIIEKADKLSAYLIK